MERFTTRRWLILLAIILAVGLALSTQVLQRLGKVDSSALVSEAEAALARRDVQAAGKLLDQVLAEDPKHASALIQRGKLWSSIGEVENAIEDWRKVEARDASSRSRKLASEARVLEANLQLSQHRAVAAEKALLASWQVNEAVENLPTLELLLRIYVVQLRRFEIQSLLKVIASFRALTLEERVLQTDAGGPIVAEQDAVAQLQAFIAADPDDELSTVALVRYLMSSERFAEAEAVLKAVPPSRMGKSVFVGLKALCQFKLNRFDMALETMATAADETEINYWWWLAAGELAEANQQWQVAAECFGFACQSQPDSGYARYRYGLALSAIGKKELSAEQLQVAATIDRLHQQTVAILRMVNLGPAVFTSGLLQIASSLRELKSDRDAAAWAQLVLQIDPTHREALALSRFDGNDRETRSPQVIVSQEAARQHFGSWVASRLTASAPAIAQSIGTESTSIVEPTRVVAEIQPRFVDVHEVAQLDFQYFNGNSGYKYLLEAMGGGVSMLDFDNDGWPDCYFPQGCSLPVDPQNFDYLDQIYRNLDGQQFTNVTVAARVVENGYSQGAAAADINNDGFTDVVVANFGCNRVFINQGDGTFIDATEQWGMPDEEMSSSLALADLDLDGNLDLYVVNYLDRLGVCRGNQGEVSTCNPQNFSGVQDRLYRNSGDSRFVDVTRDAGVVAENGKGLGVVVTDLDDDGLPDIYVTNDTTPNFLFKNLGSMRFEEIGLASGTALSEEGGAQAGMGIAVGDLNGDLRSDLFVTNFYLEANNLYLNRGAMIFKDEARQAKLSQPSKRMLGFGAQAADIDLDGDLDLIVANGHIDDFTTRGDPWKMPTQLLRNRGDGTFEDCSIGSGDYFTQLHLGRGVASCDWNRDGRVDFVVVHQDAPAALLKNVTEVQNRSVQVRLIGRASNRDAIGAKLLFKVGEGTQRRDVTGGDGFYATNERVMILGNPASESCSIEVVWPSGRKNTEQIFASEGWAIIHEK